MEVNTYIKNLRISAKKLRFFLPEVKKLGPVNALPSLMYMPNRPAKILYKSIKSALDNAKNVLKVDEKTLRFKHLSVEEGHRLKRYRAGARGTAKPILKRFAHIKIILEAEEPKIEKQIEAPKLKVEETKKKVSSTKK